MSIVFDSHLDYHVNISYGNACVPATISQHKHTFRWKMCGNLEKSQFHWVRKVNENNTIVQLLFLVCVWVERTTLYLVLRLCQGSLDLAEDQINVCTRHENICSMTISNFRFCRHLNVYLTTHIFTFTQLLCCCCSRRKLDLFAVARIHSCFESRSFRRREKTPRSRTSSLNYVRKFIRF